MAKFGYVAKDTKTGKKVKGEREAETQQIAKKMIESDGLKVLEIRDIGKKKKRKFQFGTVKAKDKSIFCRQFSTMVNAGVHLVRCLDVLEQQSTNPRMKLTIHEVRTDVEGGATLSRAMAQHPKVFDNLFLGLVRAGEVGGALDETLERLSGFLEKDIELRRKVKAAMTYPTIVMVAAAGIVTFLVYFILPQFAAMFKDMGVKQMPATTQFLIDVSNFIRFHTVIAIILVVAVVAAYRMINNTKPGKKVFDICRLKVPVFGSLTHKVAVARFARTLATLMGSGVPILQAFDTVASAMDNVVLSNAIVTCRDAIRQGETIAKPLQRSKLFPPMVIHMVSIGEESGALDAMLTKVADFYDSEVDAALAALAAAIEPLLIVVLGFIVGFIVISMFMPLLAIISSLSNGG